jgi:hypothetical protein
MHPVTHKVTNLKCFAYSYFKLPFDVKINICDEYP